MEGHVNRGDLMEQFGLTVNQASADLNRYISYAPDARYPQDQQIILLEISGVPG